MPERKKKTNGYSKRKRESTSTTSGSWRRKRNFETSRKKEDAATDEDVKRALHYMLEVTVEALKLKFKKNEVHGLAKLVLLERRKKAVEMQWVSPSQAQSINSIWCPLPYPCEEMIDDDEEELFMTLST